MIVDEHSVAVPESDRPAAVPPYRRVLIVTGTLAEPALRRVLGEMQPAFDAPVAVLRITVAALMTTPWIARHLEVPTETDLVLIPGLCEGDTGILKEKFRVAVEKGPKDLREIPRYFGQEHFPDYGRYSIEILAEINNAPKLSRGELRAAADYFRASGADLIDIGCTPNVSFPGPAYPILGLGRSSANFATRACGSASTASIRARSAGR